MTESLTSTKAPRVGWSLAACIGLLVVSNVVANRVLPSWAVIPWNLAVAGALIVLAIRVGGRSAAQLGLSRSALPSGFRWGGGAAGLVLVVYLIGAAIPATRSLFEDSRVDGSVIGSLAQALLWVPLGTVVIEEVAFRGVLPALFAVRWGRTRANFASAILFGLWHVLPAWRINTANPVFREALPGTPGQVTAIVLGVIATAIAGLVLSWLRDRSGSLLAPVMLHTATNGFGYIVGWMVQYGPG